MTIYLAIMKHNSSGDPNISVHQTYDKAIDSIHKFFKSYNFKLVNGVAMDEDNEVLDDITIHKKTRVKRFVHADGEGPSGEIIKTKLKT